MAGYVEIDVVELASIKNELDELENERNALLMDRDRLQAELKTVEQERDQLLNEAIDKEAMELVLVFENKELHEMALSLAAELEE